MVGSPDRRTGNGTDANTTPLPGGSPVSRPPSAVWQERLDLAKFREELTMRLNALQYRIERRFDMYGEAACEHAPGLAPPDVREESQRKTEALLEEIMDRPTSPDDSEDDRAIASWRTANRELLRDVRAAKKNKPRREAEPAAEAVKSRKTADTAVPPRHALVEPRRSTRVAAAKAALLGPRRSARLLAARSARANG